MDHFNKLKRQVQLHIFVVLTFFTSLVIFGAWLARQTFPGNDGLVSLVVLVIGFILTSILSIVLTNYALHPLGAVWKAVLHVGPGNKSSEAPPDISNAKVGQELVTSLALQVYELASKGQSQTTVADQSHRSAIIQSANIVSRLPLPLFVFNTDQLVTNASDAALDYCDVASSELFGKPLFDSLDLEFPSDFTLEKWVNDCQENKVTDTARWERVRMRLHDDLDTVKHFDMAAYYNRDNPSGAEFIVTFFDRTALYDQDDKAMSFVSMAVHELRTPVTLLRGYIEVFQEELGDSLDDELKDFMHKMEASASRLNAFVNNILNVAKVEENQLTLQLVEMPWTDTLNYILNDLEVRAQVHGITIERSIDDNLPTVGVDKVSIYEVVANLIDNAIKYAGSEKRIIVQATIGKNGDVETTVQDFGEGMPQNVVANLFEKFYRNHRTRDKVGGTGLGLFLCKAIIGAHDGQIWASSEVGKGSTFGFSLKPYANLAEELKSGNNKGIVRQAHGWVKNHSLYRR
jgi:signal transduction histidine kinase